MAATLLFLPGTLCDERLWRATQQALSSQWPCVAVDYGLEDSIDAMAAKALAENAGSLIPIGLSMGGMVALEIWRQAPTRVAAMALFDTDCGADTLQRRNRRDAQILAAVHGDFHNMIETQLAPAYFVKGVKDSSAMDATTDAITGAASDASKQELHNIVVAMARALGVAAFAAQITALATRRDFWPQLKKINVPTLIACGADDRICLPELHREMAALVPAAKFVSIEAAGHLPPLEQPGATIFVLRSWLAACRT